MMRLIVVAIIFECYKFLEYHVEFISYMCVIIVCLCICVFFRVNSTLASTSITISDLFATLLFEVRTE